MAPKGKGKAQQPAITSHVPSFPAIKKPMELLGKSIGVMGAYWVGQMSDTERATEYICTITDFTLAHKFTPDGVPKSAFKLQEMGPAGTGSVGTWVQTPGSKSVFCDKGKTHASKDFHDPVKKRQIL